MTRRARGNDKLRLCHNNVRSCHLLNNWEIFKSVFRHTYAYMIDTTDSYVFLITDALPSNETVKLKYSSFGVGEQSASRKPQLILHYHAQ